MTLKIRLFLQPLRIRAGCFPVVLMVLAVAACFRAATVDAQAVSNLFIYSFNPYATNNIIISITPSTRWGLFRLSDAITISTTNSSSIRVLAMNGSVVYLGPPTTLHLPLGHYFVECNGDRDQFAVLPDNYAGSSFLGSECANSDDSAGAQRMASMGTAWVRVIQSVWALVETNRNMWDWSSTDLSVAANTNSKIIAVSADFVPSWVGSNEIISQHTAYVQALATRYKGQLAAIEIWNEPFVDKFPNTTNLDTFISFYLQLFSQAQQAIRAIDPTPQVIGPAWSSPSIWSLWRWRPIPWQHSMAGRGMITAGAPSPPMWTTLPRTGSAPSPMTIWSGPLAGLPTSDSLYVDELGLFGRSALGTDTGTNVDLEFATTMDWHRGMCRAIKTTAMYHASGVNCIIPHVLPLGENLADQNFELYGWDVGMRGPHPKTSAFLMTGYWLNGATLVDYRTPGQIAYLYAWQRTNNTSLVLAWAVEGQTVSLLNNTLAATDIYGSSTSVTALTETPVLFQSSSLTASGLLANVLAALPPNLNIPPIFSPISSQSVQKGNPLQFTVSATDSNHYSLTYSASPLPSGASFNSTTGVFSWTPSNSQVGTYTVTFTAMDSLVTSVPVSITINVVGNLFDGLADYWKFDEGTGTNAADSAGHANGTLTGFTPPYGWVPGENGSALSFDGVVADVALPSSALNFTNNFTVVASLYPRNAAGSGTFISIRSYYLASGFRFLVDSNGLYLQGQTTAGWKDAFFGGGLIQNGNWYQVAIVYDKSTMMAYVNGVYLGSVNWGGNMIMNTNAASQIGLFNGVIDDVMLFNRVLGPSEIAMLPQGVFQALTPAITSFKLTNNNAVINFTTVPNTTTSELYEVDYRSDMKTGAWSVLTNGLPGTGGTLSITDKTIAGQTKRFYRVVGHF